MSKNQNNDPPGPFGGWFGTIGGFTGALLGYDAEEWIGAFIGLIAGAYIGLAVEHIVFRLIILLIFFVRVARLLNLFAD